MDLEWLDRAPCTRHPLLPPDAWFEVRRGVPAENGLKAFLVCRFACPVRKECSTVAHAKETIYGGGWTDGSGTFINPGDGDYLDMNQAAAYLGVTVGTLSGLMARAKVSKVEVLSKRAFYHIDDIRRLLQSGSVGPPHGTLEARDLHLLRGEPLCRSCSQPQLNPAPVPAAKTRRPRKAA